jgi:L-ascorbate metabolism protein UlaG (beta-lactamase superfamily)
MPGVESEPAAITWLGHASVLVELDGARVMFDPVLRSRVGPLVRIPPAVPPEEVPPLDLVLLSHLHADHVDLPTLTRLKRNGPLIAPLGAGAWLSSHGLREIRELQPCQAITAGGVRVRATAAVHGRSRRPLGPAGDPVGYVLSGSRSVYFAGDTDLFPEMAQLSGLIDVALLPVWGWGKRLGPGHLDPERAARAAALISPSLAIPIHWGTLTLGRRAQSVAERERPARQFVDFLAEHAPTVHGRVMAVGERLEIPVGEDRA